VSKLPALTPFRQRDRDHGGRSPLPRHHGLSTCRSTVRRPSASRPWARTSTRRAT
jgi:hypothetical protein